MSSACCICSDLFDEVNSISATFCGHVFHTSCLMMWFGNNKVCPNCRLPLKCDKIFKLYIDFNTTTNSSASDISVADLKAQLLAKEVELRKACDQNENIKHFVKKAEKKAAELQQAVYKYESEIADVRLKVKEIPKLKLKVKELEQNNFKLLNEVQLLNNVQAVVQGSKLDVEKILQTSGNGVESIKQMATYCSVLKRELEKLVDSKNKLFNLYSKVKVENSQYAVKLKAYENKLKRSNCSHSFESPKCAKSFIQPPITKSTESPQKTSSEKCNVTDSNNSPLTVPLNKLKFNLHIGPDPSKSIKLKPSIGNTFPQNQNDENSIIRTGYNGLGGHSNYINLRGARNF